MHRPAYGAGLRTGIEPVYSDQGAPGLQTVPLQHGGKLVPCNIGHFSAPKPLHALDTQVFDTDDIDGTPKAFCGTAGKVKSMDGTRPS